MIRIIGVAVVSTFEVRLCGSQVQECVACVHANCL